MKEVAKDDDFLKKAVCLGFLPSLLAYGCKMNSIETLDQSQSGWRQSVA